MRMDLLRRSGSSQILQHHNPRQQSDLSRLPGEELRWMALHLLLREDEGNPPEQISYLSNYNLKPTNVRRVAPSRKRILLVVNTVAHRYPSHLPQHPRQVRVRSMASGLHLPANQPPTFPSSHLLNPPNTTVPPLEKLSLLPQQFRLNVPIRRRYLPNHPQNRLVGRRKPEASIRHGDLDALRQAPPRERRTRE